MLPTSKRASLTKRLAIPPLFIILPPSEKNGKANNEKESSPEKHFCAAVNAKPSKVVTPLTHAAITEAIPIPAEIGTPANSITKNEMNNTTVAVITIIKFRRLSLRIFYLKMLVNT